MADRPILFSAPMVRAVLDGRKTQTRRILKPQPEEWQAQVIDISKPFFDADEGGWGQTRTDWSSPSHHMPMGEPKREVWVPLRGMRWAVGDRLWVRETWGVGTRPCPSQGWVDGLEYRADACGDDPLPLWEANPPEGVDLESYSSDGWRPSIFMPRWASRITLTVTDVRVQRLHDIADEDAKAEGAGLYVPGHGFITEDELRGDPGYANFLAPRQGFEAIWKEINHAGPGAWDANPYVVALTFTVERTNVDG